MQPAGFYISGVVGVHETRDNDMLTSWFGPAFIQLKHTFINLGCFRVKNNPSSVFVLLEIGKNMVYYFMVPPTW